MRILVTAGNTFVPIDRVRGITNIFTGRTGAWIAACAYQRGHDVLLVTSHPDAVGDGPEAPRGSARWRVQAYRTFEDLHEHMKAAVRCVGLDAVVHCAAVSDYQVEGIYAPASGTHFRGGRWESAAGMPTLADRQAGKVKSDEPELWLRLVRTPKLIDLVRNAWGFRGVLVKFKLEVSVSDDVLLAVAERSRQQSGADLMVANTLEARQSYAQLGPLGGRYVQVERAALAERLLETVETLHKERGRG
jgi:phosphopantothenoylcysteine synthetase/decarboxylase